MAVKRDKDGLTPNMLAFCRAYIETGNASEAYRRSYNAKNMKPETVAKRAYDLMHDRQVEGMISSLKGEVDKAATKSLGLTREWVIERLMSNAEAGSKDVQLKDGGLAPFNLAASNKALELLGKVDSIALFEERINQTGEVFVIAAPAEDEETDVEGWAQGHRGVAP